MKNKTITKEYFLEKIKSHQFIIELRAFIDQSKLELYDQGFKLTGGCLIDIVFNKPPKDYDGYFPSELIKKLNEANALGFVSESNYATTYRILPSEFFSREYIVQDLKQPISSFDFSASCYECWISEKGVSLSNSYDPLLFHLNSRRLVPIHSSDTEQIISALYRIPHWKRKGFEIGDIEYNSLLESLSTNMHAPAFQKRSL